MQTLKTYEYERNQITSKICFFVLDFNITVQASHIQWLWWETLHGNTTTTLFARNLHKTPENSHHYSSCSMDWTVTPTRLLEQHFYFLSLQVVWCITFIKLGKLHGITPRFCWPMDAFTELESSSLLKGTFRISTQSNWREVLLLSLAQRVLFELSLWTGDFTSLRPFRLLRPF